MRILAIDPGEKHFGVAISDPGGIIARPLLTFRHTARGQDAARIASLAAEHQAEMILIGIALDAENERGPQARRAERLAEAVRACTRLPVVLHDESFSSGLAQMLVRQARGPRRARRDHVHAVAAAAILQSYLDAQSQA